MFRRCVPLASIPFLLVLSGATFAAQGGDRHPGDAGAAQKETTPSPAVPLFDNLGSHHHVITTGSDEAERAFLEAARLDPECAMAFWGVALTLGPNINMPADPERNARAHEAIRKAQELSGRLSYDEPPAWYYPVRESIGGELLRAGKPQEAEKVFREDLARTPHNGRSRFGLWRSLAAQKKWQEARTARKEFEAAWKNADVKLRVADL